MTFGFSAVPQVLVADLDLTRLDALAVPGGFASAGFFDGALSAPFLAVIQAFAARSTPIAAVRVSSLALGAAGLLNGRRATTYHQRGGKRRATAFVDAPIVIDGPLLTSTGPGTAVELALARLAMLTTKSNARHVRDRMRIPTPTMDWFAPQVAA